MNPQIFQEFSVSPLLQKYVSQFFTIEVLPHQIGKVGPNSILPDGTTGLLFIESGSLQRVGACGKDQRLSTHYLFGQKTCSIHYNFNHDAVKCFGLKLSPLAFKALFDLNQNGLADKVLNLKKVLPSFPIDELMQQSGIQRKKAFLENYLLQQLKDADNPKLNLAEKVLQFINKRNDLPSVFELSQNFNVGYRFLERLFHEYIGLSPKMYLRLLRFNRVIAAHHQNENASLHHLALDFGYFDQMHLIRDMKLFTSQTPSRFFARHTPDLEWQHRNFLGQHFTNV